MTDSTKIKRPPLNLDAAFVCFDILAKDGMKVHEERFKRGEITREVFETIKADYEEARQKLIETIRAPKNRERPTYKGPPTLKLS